MLEQLGIRDFRLSETEARIWRLYDLATRLSDPVPFSFQRREGEQLYVVTRFLPSLARLDYATRIFPEDWRVLPDEYALIVQLITWMRDYERKILMEKPHG